MFLVVALGLVMTQTPTIKVATYNIQALHDGADGVIATIRGLDADVVVLQEVDRNTKRSGRVDQPEVLAKALGMHVKFGAAMPFDDGEYGLAVLSKTPLTSVKVHKLPRHKKEEPRILLEVTTEIRGKKLTVLNTHLAAEWHAEDPEHIRLIQAQDIVKKIKAIKGPIVLAGDFNCEPGSPPIVLLDHPLKRLDDDVKTHPSDAPERALDHVFTRGTSPDVAPHARAVASTASDHVPLIVELALP